MLTFLSAIEDMPHVHVREHTLVVFDGSEFLLKTDATKTVFTH